MKRLEKYFKMSEDSDTNFLLNDISAHLGVSKDGKFIWCRDFNSKCINCIFNFEDMACEDAAYNYFAEEVEE